MMVSLKSFLLLLVVCYSTFSYGESGWIRSAEQGKLTYRNKCDVFLKSINGDVVRQVIMQSQQAATKERIHERFT